MGFQKRNPNQETDINCSAKPTRGELGMTKPLTNQKRKKADGRKLVILRKEGNKLWLAPLLYSVTRQSFR